MTEQDMIIQQLRRENDDLRKELDMTKTVEMMARMCYWPEKGAPLVLYGYEVKQLVVLANILKDGAIRPDELRRYTDGVEDGYRKAMEDFQKSMQDVVNRAVYGEEKFEENHEEEKPE